MTPEPVRALVAVVVEEEVERKKDKPPKRDKTFPPSAPDDNGPLSPFGFGVAPSAVQPPPADDEQGDADDQGRGGFGGGAEGDSPES